MSVSNSAGAHNRRVGFRYYRGPAPRGRSRRIVSDWGLVAAIDRGWRHFWAVRKQPAPRVSKTQVLASIIPVHWLFRSPCERRVDQ